MEPLQPRKGDDLFKVTWWLSGTAWPELNSPDSVEEWPLATNADHILIIEASLLFFYFIDC